MLGRAIAAVQGNGAGVALAGNLPAMVPMLMVMANVYFFVDALDMRSREPRAARLMLAIAALAGLGVSLRGRRAAAEGRPCGAELC